MMCERNTMFQTRGKLTKPTGELTHFPQTPSLLKYAAFLIFQKHKILWDFFLFDIVLSELQN